MKTKVFSLLCAAVAALALVVAFSSCKKDNPVQEEKPELDFSKLILSGTSWTLEIYSVTGLDHGSTIWVRGGDAELSQMMLKGETVHLDFTDKFAEIKEDEQIFAPYSWDGTWLLIGTDELYMNEAKPTFKVEGNYVKMEWDSNVRGAYPQVLIKAYIEKSKLKFK